jgi:hypothetical protein
MTTLRGTIFKRGNGTYTVLAEPTWDATQSRYRRPSLGTFKTREEALRARLDYNVDAQRCSLGGFSMIRTAQSDGRCGECPSGGVDGFVSDSATPSTTSASDRPTTFGCRPRPHSTTSSKATKQELRGASRTQRRLRNPSGA